MRILKKHKIILAVIGKLGPQLHDLKTGSPN